MSLIDLTDYKAWAYGVSRRHLCISRREGCYCVMDLGSNNGTRLHEELLVPQMECLLNEGAELYLSQMKVIVRFA